MPDTPHEVITYLLQRGLLQPEHIVGTDFVLHDLTRRNNNFLVTSPLGPSYLVKQSMDPQDTATLANEARVCRFLSSIGNLVLREGVPRCRDYDSEGSVLVLEAAPNGRSLAVHHAETGRVPILLARSLGKVLASVHQATRAFGSIRELALPYHRPWLFSVLPYPSLQFLAQTSGAMMELVRIIQQFPRFCERLESLAPEWCTDALIHGDLKWDNCIAVPRSNEGRMTRVIITDWEFAGIGDAWWDVGCVLAEYLRTWLSSGPADREISPIQFVENARHSPESLQPAVRSFWDAYLGAVNSDTNLSRPQIDRAVMYAAACLIQRTFEDMQSHLRATAGAVFALQLSFNLLERPREAAERLFGIP